MCNSQKRYNSQNSNAKSEEIIYSSESFFYSNENGGTLRPSFSIIKNQNEFNEIISKDNNPKFEFPKNQKVIKYNLGEFRAGDHTLKKINRFKINNNTLEIFVQSNTPKRKRKLDELENEISVQVVTRPYIIFSVPMELKFNNIKLYYE